MDQTIEMDEELNPDAVQRSKVGRFDSGGNGINVSQFIRALGSETVATGIVGGFTGYFIRENLKTFDVSTDFCEVDTAPTRMNTTLLTPDAEFHLNQSGPEVDASLVDELVEVLQAHDPEIVDIGGSLPPGMDYTAVDRLAAAGDWETAIDVHGELLPDLEETYEYCKPNEHELADATGIEINSMDDLATAARELQSWGFERVIASMGSEGAMMVTPEETLFAPALDVEAVDTVGAGDSLFAATLWAFEQGWSDEDALRAGVATSSRIVGTAGTSVHDLNPQDIIDNVKVWTLQE